MKERSWFMATTLCLLTALVTPPVGAAEREVTLARLLEELTDRAAIARLPDPAYTQEQASSWDRSQKGPDELATWFANKDFDRALRVEERDGRKEFVIMDASGPGCITRWWMPLLGECKGQVVRIYLDGSETPTMEENLHRLLSGEGFIKPPLASRGPDEGNLYFPIPYNKGCKITLDGPRTFFYIINYRSYPEGTPVETFSMERLPTAAIERAAATLNAFGPVETGTELTADASIAPGGTWSVELPEGPSAIRHITLDLDPSLGHEALRGLVVSMRFDDEETVWCPVAEFFGGGVYQRPTRDWSRSVAEDGTFTSSWIMPYRNSGTMRLLNLHGEAVQARVGVRTGAWTWDERSMHFHAAWRGERLSAPPRFQDWNYVVLRGQGTYVGDTLTVYSPHKEWWGEGDERVYVDGERVPSHLGTGTEDYYGHAWGMRDELSDPFLSVPSRDSRGNDWRGYTTVSRVRMLDAIPFTTSLQIDMEVWSWKNQYELHYAVGSFWYALPGAACEVAPDPDEARRDLPRYTPPAPVKARRVKGALEGEELKILACTGGATEHQHTPQYGWSNHRHLWWRDGKPGDELKLSFEAPEAGAYQLKLHLTKAIDYGIVQASVNGVLQGEPIDGYNDGVVTELIDLGEVALRSGSNELTCRITGANPKAEKRHMFGLDYLLAVRKAKP